jgi:hypothetical protein
MAKHGSLFQLSVSDARFVTLVPDLRILAFQLLEDLEALGQLGEDVDHGVGEVGVLRVLLELITKKEKQ